MCVDAPTKQNYDSNLRMPIETHGGTPGYAIFRRLPDTKQKKSTSEFFPFSSHFPLKIGVFTLINTDNFHPSQQFDESGCF